MEDPIRAAISARRFGEAFELLLAAYQHKVVRLACAMLGDPVAAEEDGPGCLPEDLESAAFLPG